MDEEASGRCTDELVEIIVRASPIDIERLGAVVDQLRSGHGQTLGGAEQSRPRANARPSPVAVARFLLLQRRARGVAFADCDFGEAVWDVMLHLYVAHHEQRQVGAYALAAVIDVPQSTALRWLATMEGRGQLIRQPDSSDRRRSFVTLAPPFRDRIAAHLEHVRDEMMAISNDRHDHSSATYSPIGIYSSCAR